MYGVACKGSTWTVTTVPQCRTGWPQCVNMLFHELARCFDAASSHTINDTSSLKLLSRMAQALLVAQARLDLLQRQLDAALTASTAPMTSRKSAMKNRSCHFAKQRMWSTSWQQQLLLQVGRLGVLYCAANTSFLLVCMPPQCIEQVAN